MEETVFNIEEFNKNFPSYEKQYYSEKKGKKLITENGMKEKWEEKYPSIPFNQLKKQSDKYKTHDSCIHYKITDTEIIYSWDIRFQKWVEHKKDYQKFLAFLFE